MFYGDFRDGRRRKVREAIDTLRSAFDPVWANDNLIALGRNQSFLWDEKFRQALKANANTPQEKSLAWRFHTLCWAGRRALSLPGDFVECGVWRGVSFAVVTDYLDFATVPKTLYLYDTFEGIPAAYNSENLSNAVYAKEPDLHDKVVARFAKYPNVRIVKGVVPDTFAEVVPETISLLHIDMNSSAAEVAALEVLYDRVVPGGVIVLDDFGWRPYVRQTVAEIDFMERRGVPILESPTGQGIVVKP